MFQSFFGRLIPAELRYKDESDKSLKSSPPIPRTKGFKGRFHMSEIRQHNRRDDCWLLIDGKVYDVSGSWMEKHPGGADLMLSYAGGIDATDVFNSFHHPSVPNTESSSSKPIETGAGRRDKNFDEILEKHTEQGLAFKLLSSFYVGDLILDSRSLSNAIIPSTSALALEHRRLIVKFRAQGLYRSDKFFYAYKMATNGLLLMLAIILLFAWPVILNKSNHGQVSSSGEVSTSASASASMLAAIALAFFWQQCGWLSHDFLHHQVFHVRQWNNAMGYFLGNVCQGFSVAWWKAKHNLHHAVPNVAGFDPDIDTMPFLAWSEKLIEGELVGLPLVLIRYQYLFYLPLLCAARVSWLIQSFLFACTRSRNPFLEVSTLLLHYLWLGFLAFSSMPFLQGLLFLAVSQAFTGLLLAMAFSLNHNGMDILEKDMHGRMEFNRLQVITARNVREDPLGVVHWFMGGLDLQIEHHLFPTVPRHNLRKIQKDVIALCSKHGISYHQTGFCQGTKELFCKLYSVGASL